MNASTLETHKHGWPFELTTIPTIQNRYPIQENLQVNNPLSVSIVSFNILAESFLSPRSHRNLPPEYASIVFEPKKRRSLLLQTLQKLIDIKWSDTGESNNGLDVLCLQEVDMYEDLIEPFMKQNGYEGFLSKTTNIKTKKKQKEASCAIFWKSKKFSCIRKRVVDFDELAKEEQIIETDNDDDNDKSNAKNKYAHEKFQNDSEDKEVPSLDINGNPYPSNPPTYYNKKIKQQYRKQTPSSLTGVIQSFIRRNTACMVLLKCIDDSSHQEHVFAVTSSHLYWNPKYEYVKLAQSKYLLEELHTFINSYDNLSTSNGDINKEKDEIDKNNQYDSMRINEKREESNQHDVPVIVCGDMNSKPDSMVYNFFVSDEGVNAKRIAPWYCHKYDSDDDNAEIPEVIVGSNGNNKQSLEKIEVRPITRINVENDETINETTNEMQNLSITNSSSTESNKEKEKSKNTTLNSSDVPRGNHINNENGRSHIKVEVYPKDLQIRYLLDFSLNKFTRWLRMLGIDAGLETEEEEEERTRSSDPRITLFERCKKEKRTLITTSYKLLHRKGCPPGSYLINPTKQNMEQSLCHLLLTHGVILKPTEFLVRCVKCNGSFREITTTEEKEQIFIKNNAPMLMDLSVWECQGCAQGYWWSERPGSSASRVKNQVTKLFRLALRAGVEYKEPLGMFDFVNVQEERKYGSKKKTSNVHKSLVTGGKMEAMEWLKNEHLRHPFQLRSIYAKSSNHSARTNSKFIMSEEMLPFTNVTDDFVGTLDYVFFESNKWNLVEQLSVPTSFNQMNVSKIEKGHLIPSAYWPSDHLAIGGKLILKSTSLNHVATSQLRSY